MPSQAAEKARIIEAAYRCLTASNGATASITDILAEAGLSTRAFYRHFESKDGLLLAMFRDDADRVISELRGDIAAASSPGEALRGLIHGLLRLTAEEARRQRVLILTSGETQRARGYATERMRFQNAQDAAIEEVLRAGRDDGSFPWADPEPDARAIRAALDHTFEEQMANGTPSSAAEAADQVTNFALRALGAATGNVQATSGTQRA